MKTGPKTAIIVIVVLIAAAGGAYLFRGKLLPGIAGASGSKDPVKYSTVKVTRGDLGASVSASGQFQPNTVATIRPDSNMPTRKIVKILAVEGQRVKAGDALAEIDATGLDLSLKSADANYQAQKVKLANLKAKPADMDLAAAEASLTQMRVALEAQQENYDSVKVLADKRLASRNQLSDAERQLVSAKAAFEASQLSYKNVQLQSQEDQISAQESALSQADNDRQMAQIVLDSAVIRSPIAGVVAEILINVGDLVSPSTSIATVIDSSPIWLQAQVNENDMSLVKVGQKAVVTPSAYPDLRLQGKVTQIDLHAQIVNNVSVFTATVEVPNKDGKLLWGMNADAEISVLALKGVLTVPNLAIKTVNGASQVSILDGGQLVSWDVQIGATDGTRTQIVSGLDEGEEVVVQSRTKASSGSTTQGGPPGGAMGQVFRVLR